MFFICFYFTALKKKCQEVVLINRNIFFSIYKTFTSSVISANGPGTTWVPR